MHGSKIRSLAQSLGIMPNTTSLNDEDALYEIANRLGMHNYTYNDENNRILYDLLKNMEQQKVKDDLKYDQAMKDLDNALLEEEAGRGYDENGMIDAEERAKKADKDKVDKKDVEGLDPSDTHDNGKSDDLSKDPKDPNAKNGNKDETKDEDKESSGLKKEGLTKDKPEGERVGEAVSGPGSTVNNGYNGGYNTPQNKSGVENNTDHARAALDHQNKVRDGKAKEEAAENAASKNKNKKNNNATSGEGENAKSGKAKGKTEASEKGGESKPKKSDIDGKGKYKGNSKNIISNAANAKDKIKHPFKSIGGAMAKKMAAFFAAHPYALIAVVFIIIFLIIILVCLAGVDNKFSKNGGNRCTYELEGITSTGTLSLEGVQVELINCDGTASNYTVLETVDFEKYVLGVALAEIGESSPEEAIKAQIVAVRNFSLTRNKGMCPGNQDDCFYGYNATTGKIRMRACEADQVYWDYDKDIYRQDRGAISLYSPEVNSGTLWKSALSQEKKDQVLAIAEDVKGKVLLNENGQVLSTNYNATTSNQFISGANEGLTYEQILENVYGSGRFSSAVCSSPGNIDYGDYVLSSDGHEILHQSLDSFLSGHGSSLEEFNGMIADNVDDAGFGTRAGVVASAVTLIGELGNNYGVKVPYFWGGGHAGGIDTLANGSWGSTSCHTYANNQHYSYCGLDCSGFVPWAIRNGGFNMPWARLAGDFQNMPGVERVSLYDNVAVLQPGDLLESSQHIVLVVGVDETAKQYICAEAGGNATGVLFTRRSFGNSGYWGVKMDGYYNNPSNIRSDINA